MTPENFAKIVEYDRRCGEHLLMLIPVFQDRRDLLEYVKELQTAIADVHRWDTAEPDCTPIFPQLRALLLMLDVAANTAREPPPPPPMPDDVPFKKV